MIKKLIIALLILTSIVMVGCSSNSTNTGAATVELEAENYLIPANQITDQVQKFEYTTPNGVMVRFMAVKGSDGEVRTAFDACDVCGGAKGYRQEGKDITCNNCGRSFIIDGLGTQNKGYGCWPSYLSHAEENGNIVIKTSELEAGAYRFA